MKSNFKKLISLLIMISMLTISLVSTVAAMPESIVERKYEVSTPELVDGTEISVIYENYSSPSMRYKEARSDQFTTEDITKLGEAVANADYSKYELIKGPDYEIKHISLDYGFGIDIVSINTNDTLSEKRAMGISSAGFPAYGQISVNYVYNNTILASLTMYATFEKNSSNNVYATYKAIVKEAYVSGISYSNDTPNGGNASSSTTLVYASPIVTFNGNNIQRYMSVSCTIDGYVSTST